MNVLSLIIFILLGKELLLLVALKTVGVAIHVVALLIFSTHEEVVPPELEF